MDPKTEPQANQTQQEPETAPESPVAETAADATQPADDWERKYRELNDQYVRLAADFDNFRKRSYQEHESARKYGTESTLREMIPVLDNLDRATASLSESSDPKLLFQSFRLMYNQLLDTFANLGLKKMQPVGQPFDPNFHEAVSQVETDEHPDQTVVNEMQSGYMLYDTVIRPAMVAVSTRPAVAASAENPFKVPGSESTGFSPDKESK
jgi:molecular chaperone GrpE